MKTYRILTFLGAFALFLSSCGGTPTSDTSEAYSEEPRTSGDGYVDVLPTDTEDGPILHCFNWTFKQIEDNLVAIKDSGFRSVQTSPVAQPKASGAQWWSFYQPLSYSIATSSPLGTKDELIHMCDTAHTLGMSVIVDVVFNHMATTGEEDSDGLPIVDPTINEYEPYIYEHRDTLFHHKKASELSGSSAVTQYYPELPDLNTADPYIQQRSLDFLKECIDAGVDGFRFDAAKHIETPDDPQDASDFWPNTLGVAKEYYKTLNPGKELFAYGEILNNVDGGRDISSYLKYMKVTDNSLGSSVYNSIFSSIDPAKKAAELRYGKKADDPNDLITWVESHDDFTTEKSHKPYKMVSRVYAALASRKGSIPLYLAQGTENALVGTIGSYDFERPEVSVLNAFHNRFVDADEYRSYDDTYYVIERYSNNDKGAVLLDCSTKGNKRLTFSHLDDGYYFDQISGRQYHIENGSCFFVFDSTTPFIVLTKTANNPKPYLTISSRGESYVRSLTIKLSVTNCSSASYKIDNGEPVSFTKSASVTIGDESYIDGQITKLTITYSNGTVSYTRSFEYKFVSLIEGGFNVINFKESYLTDYGVYTWSWPTSTAGGQGDYRQNYEYNAEKQILLITDYSSYTGFLLVLFEKDYVIPDLHKWDNNLKKQSADIDISSGFFDASNF